MSEWTHHLTRATLRSRYEGPSKTNPTIQEGERLILLDRRAYIPGDLAVLSEHYGELELPADRIEPIVQRRLI